MQLCKNCHAENQVHDVYCYRCGLLLAPQPTASEQDGTKLLKSQTERLAMPKRRWGTARLQDQARLTLRVRGLVDKPIQVVLEDEDVIIGRNYGDVVVGVDLTNHGAAEKGVSRRHAKLTREFDTVTITDLGSANHTFINGQRIIPNESRILRDGDEVRLGKLVMNVKFEDTPEDTP